MIGIGPSVYRAFVCEGCNHLTFLHYTDVNNAEAYCRELKEKLPDRIGGYIETPDSCPEIPEHPKITNP